MTGPLTVPGLLDKLAARQSAAKAEIPHLREQVAKLTDALATAERERARWAGAARPSWPWSPRSSRNPPPSRAPVTPAYPQIIEAFTRATGPLRAKQVCQALGSDTDARHVEGLRSKLKKLPRPRHPDRGRGRRVRPRREAGRAPRKFVDGTEEPHATDLRPTDVNGAFEEC